ncbi:MAG TPA: hypothetical protein VF323_12035 [Candidatus Limnocylindrales bacterium]
MSLFPILLVVHIALAISVFLPSVLLPFALRTGSGPAGGSPRRVTAGLLAMQGTGTIVIGGALAVTGILLVSSLGLKLLQQPWLLVALVIYGLNLALAVVIQRPNLRRLVGTSWRPEDRAWAALARRQRYVSYAMAGLIGAIGWLMSTKPVLW